MKLACVSALALAAFTTAAFTTAAGATPPAQTIAVCSPGSPGTSAEAQPALDAFANAVAAKAGTALTAVYDPSEDGGVARLKTANIGLVSLPFFFAHERDLGLHARLGAQQKGRPALEQWTLVAGTGKVHGAAGLAGFTIVSNAAFAPAFVRGSVLGGFGALPASAKLSQSSAVLSALRRAANGEPIAVVLDGTQAAALPTLPFAAKLEVVAKSPEMPAGVVATVDARLPDRAWTSIGAALVGLAADKAGAAALDGIQMTKLTPIDDKALAAARTAYASAAK